MSRLRIATGIDLPLAPSCGSMILCSDVYTALDDHAVTDFFCLPPADPSWDHGFASLKICHSVKKPYGPEFAHYVDALTREVEASLGRGAYDVIHAQHLGYGLSLAFSRARGTIPMVAVAHGTDVIEAMTSAQARDALREVVDSSAEVVLPTAAMRDHVNQLTGGRSAAKLTVVPWGVPLRKAAGVHRPHRRDVLNLLHAGRLDRNKSTVTALECLRYTARPHRLTIVGSGPELDRLAGQAAELDLLDRITFEPFAPRQQLWQRFAAHDAFLMTTSGLEAFGLVAVEAQAHGLPVLYSNVAGMPATVGAGGLAYEPGDARSLATAVDTLAEQPRVRGELAQEALRNAGRFDIARTALGLSAASARATGTTVGQPDLQLLPG